MMELPVLRKVLLAALLAGVLPGGQGVPVHLIVVDPGHFHATLLQREMYPDLDRKVSVYARLGPELLDYLNRISLFNNRPQEPTDWELDIHTSDRPLEAMLEGSRNSRSGDIVVFSGRNRGKIDGIIASVDAGFNVLADKPWIIRSEDLPKVEQALTRAAQRRVAAYDIMTERYEVTAQVQRALVHSADIFGSQVAGDALRPGVAVRSIHHIMKIVSGVPLRRPVWFFDVDEYGEGLTDVGTHPVDLIQWTMLPEEPFDYRKQIRMISGRHEAVRITKAQFEAVTGAPGFPPAIARNVRDGVLDYFCNNSVEYTLGGVRVNLDVLWRWEAEPGAGDVYEAAFQGTRARVELRQGAAENYRPELYVIPAELAREQVFRALDRELQRMQTRWPGIAATRVGKEARVDIPATFRVGHEEHFAQVARQFFEYLRQPASMPEWERSYMLAKYYVTTKGVEMARR
jgi:predicted dehydrogenase